jgi:TonB-dependent SusC/RagA subfamily outer membrane receptor
MQYLKIALVLISISFSSNTFSQKEENLKISGFIKDSIHNPIKNCIIFVDDIKQKKKSNKKGFYVLKLKKIPKKIMFYSAKHGITEIDYPNKSNIDITFKKMNPKEIVRFNEVDRANNIRFRYSDIYSFLRGRVSGVKVEPNKTIIVRGITSLYGSNQPLFVLNKLAINKEHLESINPSDIKSVTVLKGADASIWGVRGAAGVIIIKTY